MKVAVVVRALERGGAERQAAVTAAELARRGHDVELVTFHGGSAYRDVLAPADGPAVPVVVLAGKRRGDAVPGFIRWCRSARPDAVLGYLAGPNLVTLLSGVVRPRPLVVWGIRSGTLRGADETRLGRTVQRIEPVLSRFADLAVANASTGRDDAVERGFRVPIEVVPNGIDVERWRPRPERRAAARQALGVDDDRIVVLRVGRLHPVKDLPTLLRAVARLERGPDGRRPLLVVAGGGPDGYARELCSLAADLGVADDVRWLGDVEDPTDAYEAADLMVSSSSYGEGFSNVIGEAMACAVPCVGTDVGDTIALIGDPALLAPPEDPEALAGVLAVACSWSPEERARRGSEARARMVDEFSVPALGARLEALLAPRLAGGGR